MISLFKIFSVHKLTTSEDCINSRIIAIVFITNSQLFDVRYSLGS